MLAAIFKGPIARLLPIECELHTPVGHEAIPSTRPNMVSNYDADNATTTPPFNFDSGSYMPREACMNQLILIK
jgi:hypothetical protein